MDLGRWLWEAVVGGRFYRGRQTGRLMVERWWWLVYVLAAVLAVVAWRYG